MVNGIVTSIVFSLILGIRLIDLKERDIVKLEYQFNLFERKFKEKCPTKKYIINYNVIIYYLLRSNNYDCAFDIVPPRNYNKTIKKCIEIIENY